MTDPLTAEKSPPDISLHKVRRILDANGFALKGPWGPYQDRFQKNVSGSTFDVILPTTDDIDDFDKRLAEAIRAIAIALSKDVPAILSAIRYQGFKKFDIRARPGSKIATISYEEGSNVLYHGAELVRQAAIRAYTNEFRPQNRGRRPAMVDRYMERLEIGQTSVGSYIFSLLLPDADDALGWGGSSQGKDDHSVTKVLTQGISLASLADKRRRAPAKRMIEETGLSAEFYDHLHEIIDWTDNVAFSLSDPAENKDDKRDLGSFKRSALVPIKRTSEKIAPAELAKKESVVGTITNLNEPNIRRPGNISLKIKRSGHQRSIRVPFTFADRDTVIEAFRLKSSKFLRVEGYVKMEANGHLVMDSVSNFTIVGQGPLF